MNHLAAVAALCALAACSAIPSEPIGATRDHGAPEPVAPVSSVPDEPDPEPVEAASERELEPPPPIFPGRSTVTVHELIVELERLADEIAESKAVRSDYEQLVADHDLRDSEQLYHDYVRVKIAFEATRDGGWWHMAWTITNRKPNSDAVWSQWKRTALPDPDRDPTITAFAECDELSALFAFVARRMGVEHIGLFWPVWNHVVAVWTVPSHGKRPARIVVPTSQIFLTHEDSLGTRGFNPWKQNKIYEYRRRDVRGSHELSADLARFFVEQVRRHGTRSQLELQAQRNARAAELVPASG